MALSRMYDSAPHVFPAGATSVALYANGLYRWTGDLRPEWSSVLWIDVFGNSPEKASILDVETHDATPAQVPGWCAARLEAVPDTLLRLYCNLSTWPAVKHAVRTLRVDQQRRVRYWIANPTGLEHIVPGSAATQWKWGRRWDTSSYTAVW